MRRLFNTQAAKVPCTHGMADRVIPPTGGNTTILPRFQVPLEWSRTRDIIPPSWRDITPPFWVLPE